MLLDPSFIGNRVRDWKVDNSVTMKSLGEILAPQGVTGETYITLYKRAKRFLDGNPSMRLDQLNRIAKHMEVDVTFFLK
jgi:hypothetical protein